MGGDVMSARENHIADSWSHLQLDLQLNRGLAEFMLEPGRADKAMFKLGDVADWLPLLGPSLRAVVTDIACCQDAAHCCASECYTKQMQVVQKVIAALYALMYD